MEFITTISLQTSIIINYIKVLQSLKVKKCPAIAERLHPFYIISPGTFSVKLSLLRLSFPFPSWRSPVLPPALTHPRHPPGPDGYRCSALLRYRYAPSDTGASLDSYLTSPYCCSKCDGRHVNVSSQGQKKYSFSLSQGIQRITCPDRIPIFPYYQLEQP